MPAPTLASCLPELWRFICALHQGVATGELTEDGFVDRCDSFFTSEEMAAIELVVPRWTAMASFQDGKTLRHTAAALVALLDLDEYRRAQPGDRHLMEWTVLLHDIAKEMPTGVREHVHAFKSAAHAGLVLPSIGFGVNEAWWSDFGAWHELTNSAFRYDAERGTDIQDNTKLGDILGGAERLFTPDTARVIKAIALHLSVTVLEEWPQTAPLSSRQERELIDPELQPLLLSLMLADSGGWNLFDPGTLAAMYEETREVFAGLGGGE